MRTTLDLPEELVRQAKILAVQRRSTLRDVVAAGLRHEITLASAAAPGCTALPRITLAANAPVLMMTPTEISAALHHEEALDDSARAG